MAYLSRRRVFARRLTPVERRTLTATLDGLTVALMKSRLTGYDAVSIGK
jgi:hypothetical protein